MFDRLSPTTLRLVALLTVLVLLLGFFSTQIENYLTPNLFNRISTSVAIIALIATGQALVMLTRNIDLSLGSVCGFVAFFVGVLVAENPDLPPVVVVLAAIAVGGGLGALNGLLIAYGRIPSIIVTLGSLAIFRSVLVQFSGARTITTDSLPQWLLDLPRNSIVSLGGFDLRVSFFMTLVVVVVVHLALTRLRAGRQFFAVGSNPEAAAFAGIDAARTVLVAFILSGALSGLAGFMFLSRFGNITVVAGLGFELQSVAAAVVGGVSIMGGSGSVIGALLGAATVDLLQTSLSRWDLVSEFWREAVLGLLILLSVTADAVLMSRLMQGRARRARERGAGK